ncbi:UPF0394 membrane protein [Porphyridium purpureum]|uniref:UPF0394 membrane protein n=1 Tax=Porphyridium purpureum TaxID=35688 RepID=A0A5J4YS49_PORPP|nr:UPF0394 membrane protein [Porphyridium purpureum]|eukprot:POR9356..scf229_5
MRYSCSLAVARNVRAEGAQRVQSVSVLRCSPASRRHSMLGALELGFTVLLQVAKRLVLERALAGVFQAAQSPSRAAWAPLNVRAIAAMLLRELAIVPRFRALRGAVAMSPLLVALLRPSKAHCAAADPAHADVEAIAPAADAAAVASTGTFCSRGKFAPLDGALGGVSIGLAVVANALLFGRVTGNSGALAGALLTRPRIETAWRFTYLAGLAGAGWIARRQFGCKDMFAPDIFESVDKRRMLLGSFLVGIGSAIGNGCTSGHSICGMSRLSTRSIAFTLSYMTTAFVTSKLSRSGEAFGLHEQKNPPPLAWPSRDGVIQFAALNAAFVALYALAYRVVAPRLTKPLQKHALHAGMSLVSGLNFGFGLCVSGMVRPDKVISFLDFDRPWWDPSLAFVMASALTTAAIGFYALKRRGSCAVFGCDLSIPAKAKLDMPLLLGSVLFGAGWGTLGVCNGPLTVAIGADETGYAKYAFVAMLVGIASGKGVAPFLPK